MTIPKKFVFVLMPFEESFNDIYTYGIKQTCVELNTYCERVDEQIFSERILDRVYNQIAKADIIVADMSNRNANVFYEVGYAHALGKNVVLLTQKADDIPFDLKHFPHIIYQGQIKTLSTQLKTRLEWFLNADTIEDASNFDFGLEFLINGNKIEDGRDINILQELKYYTYEYINLKIDIFNSSTKIFRNKFKIGFETQIVNKEVFEGLEIIKPSSDNVLFVSKEVFNIYPFAYKSIDFRVLVGKSIEGKPSKLNLTLKIFTSLELREIPFTMTIPTTILTQYEY